MNPTTTATRRQPAARKPVRPAHGVARLTLHINGTTYAVRPLACDAEAASLAFRLRKADGTAYVVAMTPHGACCDCPDWTMRRDGLDPEGCKHIKAMTVVGLIGKRGCGMTIATDDRPEIVPVNGQPATLAETIDDEARSYRAWGTPMGDFLAGQLERVAQLVRWTGATTPDEHEGRMEVWDDTLREQWFDRGFSEGITAARRATD